MSRRATASQVCFNRRLQQHGSLKAVNYKEGRRCADNRLRSPAWAGNSVKENATGPGRRKRTAQAL
jgi:hypothetical protein